MTMHKTMSAINRQLGVIEGAMAGVPQNVFDVVMSAICMLGEAAEQMEVQLLQTQEEVYRLSRLNTELGTQMRQMVAKQCACDCAWRQEDGKQI